MTVHVVLVSDIVDTYWVTDKKKTKQKNKMELAAICTQTHVNTSEDVYLFFAVPSHVSRISETSLT